MNDRRPITSQSIAASYPCSFTTASGPPNPTSRQAASGTTQGTPSEDHSQVTVYDANPQMVDFGQCGTFVKELDGKYSWVKPNGMKKYPFVLKEDRGNGWYVFEDRATSAKGANTFQGKAVAVGM